MIDDDKWHFVSGVLDRMKIQKYRYYNAIEPLLIPIDSPLVEPFFLQQDLLLDSLSFLVEDYGNHINWFVHECRFGRDAKEAGCKGNMKLIDSHDRLRWLIELD